MQELRILHLEDDPFFADLVESLLRANGAAFCVRRAADWNSFEMGLRELPYDLILSDYQVPGGDGLQALALCRRVCPTTPFIFLSGMMGEEVAIESLKNGAADYVLKSNLSRLIPTVIRTLNSFKETAALRAAEARIRRDRANLQGLIENTVDAIWSMDLDFKIIVFNSSASLLAMKMTGFPMVEGNCLLDKLDPESQILWKEASRRIINRDRFMQEHGFSWAGRRTVFEISFHPIVAGTEATGMAMFAKEIKRHDGRAFTATVPWEAPELHKDKFPLRILVAEDNPTNQIVVTRCLQSLGLNAEIVSNGLEALEACKSKAFDLILMDIQMPVMDGFAATTGIREWERSTGARAWISALTANTAADTKEMCLASGMDSHMHKPFQMEALLNQVELARKFRESRVQEKDAGSPS